MSPVFQFLSLFALSVTADASPMGEMMIRVEQYKEKALTAPGCGFWREVLRLHHKVLKKSSPNIKVIQAPGYCDEELVVEDGDRLDDFHMAAISWLLLKEWDNPMWSEAARNSLLARLTILPWWLDDQG